MVLELTLANVKLCGLISMGYCLIFIPNYINTIRGEGIYLFGSYIFTSKLINNHIDYKVMDCIKLQKVI